VNSLSVELGGLPSVLEARDLTRRFGGVLALDCLDLVVMERDILGLIGPNGSGKTTFFNVVSGIYSADSGSIKFAGLDITRTTPQSVYHAGIARTFQRSRLSLPLSIFDNIMVGNHKRLNQRIWFNLLQRKAFRAEYEANFLEAQALLEIFDPPLAQRMLEPVAGLPMIDRRRIEICRALIGRPRLLLLDEPSAGMTHDETSQLMDDILQVRERMSTLTIVIVEHEMGVIERITNRCAVLNFGRKIAEGRFADIAANREVREAYLGLQ
jgi:branched-chain amino acid transport system ATP-binding protein/sulfate-transporting ATPase